MAGATWDPSELAEPIEDLVAKAAAEDRTPMLEREADEARITAAALRYAAGAWAMMAEGIGIHAGTDRTEASINELRLDAINAARLAREIERRHDLPNATRSAGGSAGSEETAR
jgi:hypothetical protein